MAKEQNRHSESKTQDSREIMTLINNIPQPAPLPWHSEVCNPCLYPSLCWVLGLHNGIPSRPNPFNDPFETQFNISTLKVIPFPASLLYDIFPMPLATHLPKLNYTLLLLAILPFTPKVVLNTHVCSLSLPLSSVLLPPGAINQACHLQWMVSEQQYNSSFHIVFLYIFSICYFNFILCVWVDLPACMSVHHMSTWCPQRPQEGVGFPGIGVVEALRAVNVGAGNWAWVLWKTSPWSSLQNHLSRPRF